MKMVFIAAVSAILGLTGCAGSTSDLVQRDLYAREHRYNSALRMLGPGSTRSDLERIFPCVRPATKDLAVMSVTGASTVLWPEEHRIDADFSVLVSYDYKYRRLMTKPGHTRKIVSLYNKARAGESAYELDVILLGTIGQCFARVRPTDDDHIEGFPLRVQRPVPRTGFPFASDR